MATAKTLDADTVADIRQKVMDALSGISIAPVQAEKLEKVFADLAQPDTKAAAASDYGNAKSKAT